jgi:DNA-binding NarL/FixJ family response regulator
MRVIVVDDSMIVRDGLAGLLERAGMTVTHRLRDAVTLDAIVRDDPPDVVILDIRMPPTFTDEGLRAAERLRADHPRVGILVLSQHVDPTFAAQLVQDLPAGTGYLLKDRVTDIHVLVDALQRIAAGDLVMDPTLVSQAIQRRRREGPLERLSEREREVLSLIAEGLNNDAIARRLNVSERTVESHVANLFHRLDLSEERDGNRRVLAVLAYLRLTR